MAERGERNGERGNDQANVVQEQCVYLGEVSDIAANDPTDRVGDTDDGDKEWGRVLFNSLKDVKQMLVLIRVLEII